jgi:hypothetical protein
MAVSAMSASDPQSSPWPLASLDLAGETTQEIPAIPYVFLLDPTTTGCASDQGESTQNRRQRNALFHCPSCLNRTQVHDLLLVRVGDALASQGNNPQHNQQDPNPHWQLSCKGQLAFRLGAIFQQTDR